MQRKSTALSIASFTLVEILAAMGILSVLMTIMFGILQQTSVGWQAANRRVEASQVARLALDQIATDLENCVAVAQANVPLPTGKTTDYAFGFVHSNAPTATPSWLAPGSVDIAPGNHYIYVTTSYPGNLAAGTAGLCEVGYIPVFVTRVDGYSTMRGGRHYLLRHMPFDYGSAAASSLTNVPPLNDFLANPSEWETTPPGVTTTNRLPFVDNCIKFRVDLFYTNNNSTTFSTNSTWGRPTTAGTWSGNPAGIQGLPVGAVITLCVVDEKTAERLNRLNSGAALPAAVVNAIPTNWNNVPSNLRSTLQSSILTFQRRIYFKNRTNQ